MDGSTLWIVVASVGALVFIGTILFWPVAFNHLDKLLLLYIILAPFHLIVRGISVESVLLSGWRDVLFAVMVGLWMAGIVLGRFRLKLVPLVLCIIVLNVFGVIQVLRSDSLIVGISGFRDIIKYSLLALVTFSLCLARPAFLRKIVVVLFGIGVVVAILQIIFYFMNLDYVLRLGTVEPSYRMIGPFFVRRMEAFFGGAPSNLGIYIGVPLVIYLALQQLGQKVPRWWHFGFPFLLASLIMTLSFTAIVVVIAIYALFLLRKGGNLVFKFTALAVLLGVFAALNLSFERAVINNQEATNFFTYFINVFVKGLFLENLAVVFESPGTFFFGRGLAIVGAKQFLDASQSSDVMVIGNSDGGWAEFAVQVGLPMAILVLTTVVYTCITAFRKARLLPPAQRVVVWAMIAAAVVMLSSLHIIPWNRIGPDVNFWVVLGALATVPVLVRRLRAERIRTVVPIEQHATDHQIRRLDEPVAY